MMVNNIDVNRIHDLLPKPVGRKGQAQSTSGTSSPEASFDAEYSGLIAHALNSSSSEETSLSRARALLAAGQLDTPEAIRTAAANILQFGI